MPQFDGVTSRLIFLGSLPLIVLANKYGQLGNRLAYLKAMLAIAMEYKISVVNCMFDEYADYFIGTVNEPFCRYPNRKVKRLLPRILSRCLCFCLWRLKPVFERPGGFFGVRTVKPDQHCTISFADAGLCGEIAKSCCLFFDGWPVVPSGVIEKHAEHIRRYFSLVKERKTNVDRYIEKAREGIDLLIGIHIRQGDYRDWNQGKFFFETDDYVTLLGHICKRHHDKNVRFIIAANEEQVWRKFDAYNALPSLGGEVEDMYILSSCDEIYGPQSSYSDWAAFYGKTKLFWISDPVNFEFSRVK